VLFALVIPLWQIRYIIERENTHTNRHKFMPRRQGANVQVSTFIFGFPIQFLPFLSILDQLERLEQRKSLNELAKTVSSLERST